MINLTKTQSIVPPKIDIKKLKKEEKQVKYNTENINLNNIPHYQIIVKNGDVLDSAKSTLTEFHNEFGKVKSATYVCEEIKQAKRQNAPNHIIDELNQKRQNYSANVKKMRKTVFQTKYNSFDEYINSLKSYLHKNGTFLNCNECADLTLDSLRKKGINAHNVMIYSTNQEGNRTSFLEHIFTVAGLKENCDITDPTTWGSKAIICDAWANKCMPAKDCIDFYKDFFAVNPSKHNLKFSLCEKSFEN